MDTIELAKNVKSDMVASFYILRGDDAYFRLSAISILATLVDDEYRDSNLTSYAVEPSEVYDLVKACNTPPMFMLKKRVVLVRDWHSKPTDACLATLRSYLSDPMETTVLVVVDNAKKLAALEKYATVVECNRMPDARLQDWIRIRAGRSGLSITPNAAQLLVEYTKGKMERIATETEKLCSYSAGSITERDIEAMVTPELDVQIYELAGATLRGDAVGSMRLLEDMFRLNYTEEQIFGNLISQYRRLYYVKISPLDKQELSAYLAVKPFAIDRSREIALRYTEDMLKKCLLLLEEQMLAIRTDNLNKRALLLDCVIKLAASGKPVMR